MCTILHKNRKKLSVSEHFWKTRPAKGARDCSDSLISHKKRKKTEVFGPLLASHSHQVIHLNSFISIHSFILSFHFISFHVIFILIFIFIFICFDLHFDFLVHFHFISFHFTSFHFISFHFMSFKFLHFKSFVLFYPFQFIHFISFISCISFHFLSIHLFPTHQEFL